MLALRPTSCHAALTRTLHRRAAALRCDSPHAPPPGTYSCLLPRPLLPPPPALAASYLLHILAAAMVDSPAPRPTPSPLHTQVAELEHMTASTTSMAKVRMVRVADPTSRHTLPLPTLPLPTPPLPTLPLPVPPLSTLPL